MIYRQRYLWNWESQQEDAFKAVKQLVSTEPVLKYYDVNEEVTTQCDGSEIDPGKMFDNCGCV